MSLQIVLLNGPSGSGKTSGGQAVARWFGSECLCFGFADDLKRATHSALGMWDIPFNKYENCKNDPHEDFFGISPRKAYIAHSEVYMKKIYGNSIFSRLAVRKIREFETRCQDSLIVMTDCGFEIEADYFCNIFGPDNVLVVRLHRDGKTFEGDSREYIRNSKCPSIDIYNNSSFEKFINTLTEAITTHFLDQRNVKRTRSL